MRLCFRNKTVTAIAGDFTERLPHARRHSKPYVSPTVITAAAQCLTWCATALLKSLDWIEIYKAVPFLPLMHPSSLQWFPFHSWLEQVSQMLRRAKPLATGGSGASSETCSLGIDRCIFCLRNQTIAQQKYTKEEPPRNSLFSLSFFIS